MFDSIRNSIVFDADTSAALGDYCNQQRAAYNMAVEHSLAHPSISRFDMFKQLTQWKQAEADLPEDERRWTGPVAVLRPGLTRGRAAVQAFLKADEPVLRECIREVKQRDELAAKHASGRVRKARAPRHGNNPGRDTETWRLFRSRKRAFTLTIDDASGISVQSRRKLKIPGLVLTLARPIAADADVRAVQIIERTSSVRRGRNRPYHGRSYDIRLIIRVADPPERDEFENPVGLDIGKAIRVAASDGCEYHMPEESLDLWAEEKAQIQARQKRCKHGSRQWLQCQQAINLCNARMGNIRTNAERHIALAITNDHDAVFVEDLRPKNMTRSARGTPENPGTNVATKTGLNRTLAEVRPGSLLRTLERRCEKTGTPFVRVDARYTSQRCSQCTYTDAGNRKSQAEFRCQRCDYRSNADHNSSQNVLQKGAALYLCCVMIVRQAAAGAPEHCGRMGVPSLADSLMLLTTPTGDESASDGLLGGCRSHRAHAAQTTVPAFGQNVG